MEEDDLDEEEEAAVAPFLAGKAKNDGDAQTTLTEDQLLPSVPEKEEIIIGVLGGHIGGVIGSFCKSTGNQVVEGRR